MLSQGQTQYRTSHGFEVSTSKAKKWQSHSVSIMYGHCIWVQSLSPLSLIFEVRLLEFLCYHCNSVLNRISSIFWEESIECIALQKKVNQGNSVCSPSSSIPFFFLNLPWSENAGFASLNCPTIWHEDPPLYNSDSILVITEDFTKIFETFEKNELLNHNTRSESCIRAWKIWL